MGWFGVPKKSFVNVPNQWGDSRHYDCRAQARHAESVCVWLGRFRTGLTLYP
ncbi:MAG: hypothetical protein N0A16_02480 [Blastocatellia bacterium]|nr:hypothetical protein [Blastocatellia bacterium]